MEVEEYAANPSVAPPREAGIDAVENTADPVSERPDTKDLFLPAGPDDLDVPGPSSTFFPRQPSPPLPDLRHRAFPPNERSDDEYDIYSDEHEDDDDDDEVIATLPVYLSPSLYPHLNLHQYPLHLNSLKTPSWAKDRGKAITARVKEQIGQVEIEIPVDESSRFWRDERARDLGFVPNIHQANGDSIEGGYGYANGKDMKKKGGGGKKKEAKAEKWGDKRRLRGETIPNATGYYSGVIHEGGLHLHPISKLVQFRPSMTYLDDFESRKAGHKGIRDDGPRREEQKPASGPAANRTRQLRDDEDNDGSGSIRDFRNKLWSVARKEEEDKWVPYDWKHEDDQAVLDKLDDLLVPEDKQGRLECSTRPLDYINKDQ